MRKRSISLIKPCEIAIRRPAPPLGENLPFRLQNLAKLQLPGADALPSAPILFKIAPNHNFVYEIQIRIRIAGRRNSSPRISSRRISIRLYEIRVGRISYTKSRISYTEFVSKAISSIRNSSQIQFDYENFVSRGTKLPLDEIRIRNSYTKWTLIDEIRLNSYTEFVPEKLRSE